eukprot:160718-Hanusia_phi.AAC.1
MGLFKTPQVRPRVFRTSGRFFVVSLPSGQLLWESDKGVNGDSDVHVREPFWEGPHGGGCGAHRTGFFFLGGGPHGHRHWLAEEILENMSCSAKTLG